MQFLETLIWTEEVSWSRNCKAEPIFIFVNNVLYKTKQKNTLVEQVTARSNGFTGEKLIEVTAAGSFITTCVYWTFPMNS